MPTDSEVLDAMFGEANSAEEREYERISEHTSDPLDTLKVDVKRHKFILKGGSTLSIAETAQRIHKREPSMPLGEIDGCVSRWLEEAYWPDGVSEAKLEKLQARIEDWIEEHKNRPELTS